MTANAQEYSPGAWGRGPEHPHSEARPQLMIEPKMSCFCQNLQFEANSRANSQAALDRFYAHGSWGVLGSTPSAKARSSPTALGDSAMSSSSSTLASPLHRQHPVRSMSHSGSAPVDLGHLVRLSRNLETFHLKEEALRARGWEPTPGTSQQFYHSRT
ncbi:unnamed protein product [Polarella glacialis]|uniref:Uncharacterized protein n=1 Tax=Polarella glacialis TaxID=89957 RepID=A0A813LP58_POLGL|nr:unnamed protein product [Polarella glacialis]